MARFKKTSSDSIKWCIKPIEDRSNKELDLTIKWCDEHLDWLDHEQIGHTSHINRIKNYRAHALVERSKRFH